MSDTKDKDYCPRQRFASEEPTEDAVIILDENGNEVMGNSDGDSDTPEATTGRKQRSFVLSSPDEDEEDIGDKSGKKSMGDSRKQAKQVQQLVSRSELVTKESPLTCLPLETKEASP